MGMSDRVPGGTPLDVRMDDIRAVMDAVGSVSAAIMGESEGGPLAMLFAAAHPERTRLLILQGAEVRERTDEEWPWGESTEEEFESYMLTIPDRWGKGGVATKFAPSLAGDRAAGGHRMGWEGPAERRHTDFVGGLRTHGVRDRRARRGAHHPRADAHHPRRWRRDLPRGQRSLARREPAGREIRRAARRRSPAVDLEPTLAEIREALTGVREAE